MMRSLQAAAVLCAACAARGAGALSAYGHAYSRPGDFSESQIAQIARRFDVFTVEKGCAADVYGKGKSLAATLGTARRLKAANSSVRVLMYWNNVRVNPGLPVGMARRCGCARAGPVGRRRSAESARASRRHPQALHVADY